jgi:hypothetical protein
MKLGRRRPSDWRHVERYPLRGALDAAPANVPGVLGINWYTNFDRPVRDGTRYWIGRGSLGSIRGGHAICVKPYSVTDDTAWWAFYDQGDEGACVGFSCSRMMTLLNRRRYDAPWLYGEAQRTDEFPDTPPAEGTSVRAGCEVLRTEGTRRVRAGSSSPADSAEGIAAYRWATSWDEVRAAAGVPASVAGVPFVNSWGRSYPHIVYLADEAGARVLDEDGEFAIVTDR